MLKALVIGNLGRDAEVRDLPSGQKVINFTVAHTERWKDAKGEKKEKTTWVNCSWFLENTAIAAYLKKGTQVYVEGQPEAHSYEKREGGGHAAELRLRVVQLQLLGSSNKGEGNSGASSTENAGQPSSWNHNASPAHADDTLPF